MTVKCALFELIPSLLLQKENLYTTVYDYICESYVLGHLKRKVYYRGRRCGNRVLLSRDRIFMISSKFLENSDTLNQKVLGQSGSY